MNRFFVSTILACLTLECFSAVSASAKDQNVSVSGEIDLVGIWKFQGTDFHVFAANRMKDIFIADGMDSTQAETLGNITSGVFQDLFKSMFEKMEIRLFEDNTWLDKFGDRGKWHVDGNNLVQINEDGFVVKSEFLLDGDNLTLKISGSEILDSTMHLNEGEVKEMLNRIFKETDVIRMFLTSGLGPEDEDIFGLKKGMSISEIRALGFVDLTEQDDFVYIKLNPKMPAGASSATFLVTPSGGLLKVLFGFLENEDDYGFKIREKYEELRGLLEWKYGKGVERDVLHPDADRMLKRPEFYLMALEKGARILSWTKGFILDNQWQLRAISIKVGALDFNTGMITVIYEFDGFDEYINKQKSGF